jgi:biotin synthase
LNSNTIKDTVEFGYELGYRSFVLQGGEDSYYSDNTLKEIIQYIKNRHPNIAIALSLGERTFSSYQSLFQAGADRYLLRHETADQQLYARLHPHMSFENRIKSLRALKQIGFQTGSGFLVGLPGQTVQSYAEDFSLLQDIQPEMIGIGPFIPHHKTPLASELAGSVREVMILLSLLRI